MTSIPSPAPTVDWSACEPTEYTPLVDPGAVFRARLLALRSRGSDAQQLAGGMLAAHGMAARRVLRSGPVGVVAMKADALLELAGVAEDERLEVG